MIMIDQVLSSIFPNPANINCLPAEVHSGEPRHQSSWFFFLAKIMLAHRVNTGYLSQVLIGSLTLVHKKCRKKSVVIKQ